MDLKAFKKKSNAKGELADWLNLILGNGEMIKMVAKKNKEIEKAVKVVEEMGHDPETRELYRLIQKGRIEENTRISNALEEGYDKGYEKARKEYEKEKEKATRLAQKQETIKIAKELLKMNIDIRSIEKATGLKEKEIKELIK